MKIYLLFLITVTCRANLVSGNGQLNPYSAFGLNNDLNRRPHHDDADYRRNIRRDFDRKFINRASPNQGPYAGRRNGVNENTYRSRVGDFTHENKNLLRSPNKNANFPVNRLNNLDPFSLRAGVSKRRSADDLHNTDEWAEIDNQRYIAKLYHMIVDAKKQLAEKNKVNPNKVLDPDEAGRRRAGNHGPNINANRARKSARRQGYLSDAEIDRYLVQNSDPPPYGGNIDGSVNNINNNNEQSNIHNENNINPDFESASDNDNYQALKNNTKTETQLAKEIHNRQAFENDVMYSNEEPFSQNGFNGQDEFNMEPGPEVIDDFGTPEIDNAETCSRNGFTFACHSHSHRIAKTSSHTHCAACEEMKQANYYAAHYRPTPVQPFHPPDQCHPQKVNHYDPCHPLPVSYDPCHPPRDICQPPVTHDPCEQYHPPRDPCEQYHPPSQNHFDPCHPPTVHDPCHDPCHPPIVHDPCHDPCHPPIVHDPCHDPCHPPNVHYDPCAIHPPPRDHCDPCIQQKPYDPCEHYQPQTYDPCHTQNHFYGGGHARPQPHNGHSHGSGFGFGGGYSSAYGGGYSQTGGYRGVGGNHGRGHAYGRGNAWSGAYAGPTHIFHRDGIDLANAGSNADASAGSYADAGAGSYADAGAESYADASAGSYADASAGSYADAGANSSPEVTGNMFTDTNFDGSISGSASSAGSIAAGSANTGNQLGGTFSAGGVATGTGTAFAGGGGGGAVFGGGVFGNGLFGNPFPAHHTPIIFPGPMG